MFMNQKGFTLIELIMVIVLLGLLAAVAIPIYSDLSSQAAEGVAKQFGGALKQAYTNYIMRMAVDNIPNNIQSFYPFVAFSSGATDRNAIRIDDSIRSALADPNGDVMNTDYTTITLAFKNGGTAVYTFNPATKAISEQYTP